MKETQSGNSKIVRISAVSWKANREDLLEIIGIFFGLLVISAFLFIALALGAPEVEDGGYLVTSMVAADRPLDGLEAPP